MTSESPDEVLVLGAILGDLEAFEQLVLRYRPAVVRLARTVVGADDAEDVAQDALLLAFKALPTIEEPSRFAAWLSAITRHRALRFTQSEDKHVRKRVALDEALLEQIESLARPAAIRQSMEDNERDTLMNSAIDSLAQDYAMPLRLHYFDDMPLKRIAAFMGLPLSTIKWRIHHGKKLLRAKVGNTE